MWSRWYGTIVEKVRGWAGSDPAVRAVLIVGSQARTIVPADAYSDLDLVIFHEIPDRLIDSTDWVHQFGTVLLTTVEKTAVLDSRERRVLYADGRDVDFSIFPTAALMLVRGSPEALSVLSRGVEVLVDKDQQLTSLTEPRSGPAGASDHGLGEEEFQSAVADFWYHVLWAAKKLRRGELWTAKQAIDGYLKSLLVQMVGWQAILRRGRSVDVWHAGRLLERWAEPETLARLPATFAGYGDRDLLRALGETGRLYSDLAREVAEAKGWSYPVAAERAVRALTEAVLEISPSSG